MTTSILNKKKATKTAKVKNEPCCVQRPCRGQRFYSSISATRPDSRSSPCLPKGNAMSGDCAASLT